MKITKLILTTLLTGLIIGFLPAQMDQSPDEWMMNNDDLVTSSGFNGKVGIGIKTPRAKLDVAGSAIIENFRPVDLRIQQTGYGRISMEMVKNTQDGFLSSTGNFAIATDLQNADYSPKFWISRSGDVCIGDSTPNAKLDVRGSGIFESDGGTNIKIGQTGYGQVVVGTVEDSELGFMSSKGSIAFATNTSSNDYRVKLFIADGGNIGVGTDNPLANLDVNGISKMDGLIIPTDAGQGKVLVSDANGNATWQDPNG